MPNSTAWLAGLGSALSGLGKDMTQRRLLAQQNDRQDNLLAEQQRRQASQDALARLVTLSSLGGEEVPDGTDPLAALQSAQTTSALQNAPGIPSAGLGLPPSIASGGYGMPRAVKLPNPDGTFSTVILDPSRTPQAMQERRFLAQQTAQDERQRRQFDATAAAQQAARDAQEKERTPSNFKVNGQPVAGFVDKLGRRYDSAGNAVAANARVEPWEPTPQQSYTFPVVTGDNGQPVVARANTKTGEITPTTVGGKPASGATDTAKQAGAYYTRMSSASEILNHLEESPEFAKKLGTIAGAPGGTGSIPYVGNFLMGEDARSYKQAQDDWVRAKLRKESGAVIGAKEMADEIRTYFPVPGDGPAMIQQKRERRRVAEEAMRATAGTAIPTPGNTSRGDIDLHDDKAVTVPAKKGGKDYGIFGKGGDDE